MKCYTVAIMTLKGEYKSVYLGSDLAEAKRVNREYRKDKFGEECIAVFFFPKPYSKRVSGTARHLLSVEKAKQEDPRTRAKNIVKIKEDEEKAFQDELAAEERELKKQAAVVKKRQTKEKADRAKEKAAQAKAADEKEENKAEAFAKAVADKLKAKK